MAVVHILRLCLWAVHLSIKSLCTSGDIPLTLLLVVVGRGDESACSVFFFALDEKPLKLEFQNCVICPYYSLETLRQNFEFLACAEASPVPVYRRKLQTSSQVDLLESDYDF